MNNNNPFLNIFNGRYRGSNRRINLLANGLLPSFFNNIFSGQFPNFFGYSPLGRFPNFFNIQRPEVYTGFTGAIERGLRFNYNFRTPIPDEYNIGSIQPYNPHPNPVWDTRDPKDIKVGIPYLRDPITNEIIAE